jgi:hypothetical protein
MIQPILSSTAFAIVFLIPGLLASAIVFPKSSPIRQSAFGICLSASIFVFVNFFNAMFGWSSHGAGLIEYIVILGILGIVFWKKNTPAIAATSTTPKTQKTKSRKSYTEALIILLMAIAGTFWKTLFLAPAKYVSTAYDYASLFTKSTVPDLGFYTGMAVDHANYATRTANAFWLSMESAMAGFQVSAFLFTFAYLAFIYILCMEFFGKKNPALLATGIMALAPFEIFYTANGVFGHPLAYLAVFSLFLLYVCGRERKGAFLLAFCLCLSMSIIYYTSTMANIVLCAGFLIAILLECRMDFRKFLRDKRTVAFMSIAVFTSCFFLLMSNDMLHFTDTLIRDTAQIRTVTSSVSNAQSVTSANGEILRPYHDPNILGISAIRAQAIIFVMLTFGFFWQLIRQLLRRRKDDAPGISDKPDISDRSRIALLGIIPTVLASFAFFYAGYPARAFDYFAFYALILFGISVAETVAETGMRADTSAQDQAGIFIKNKITRIIGASIFIILMASLSLLVMRDKRVYFERSEGEVAGAMWAVRNLHGTVFSDQIFVSLLVTAGYHDVTGSSDTDPRLADMFYRNNKKTFMSAIDSEYAGHKIRYLVTTKRMRESFILMLNAPQVPVQSALIDALLEKIYDNGDVRIYSVMHATSTIPNAKSQ